MSFAIRYFTKSKKGNTWKLADRLSKTIGVDPLDLTKPLNEKVDVLFLVNAMYAADIDNNVKTYLKENKEKIALLVNVNSAATGKSTLKAVKKVCDAEGIEVSDKEYHTVASWMFLNKNRPNEEDFKRLDEFAKTFIEE